MARKFIFLYETAFFWRQRGGEEKPWLARLILYRLVGELEALPEIFLLFSAIVEYREEGQFSSIEEIKMSRIGENF